jgi:hypothetical protein
MTKQGDDGLKSAIGCFILAGYGENLKLQSVNHFSSISEDDKGFTPNFRSSTNYI